MVCATVCGAGSRPVEAAALVVGEVAADPDQLAASLTEAVHDSMAARELLHVADLTLCWVKAACSRQ